MNTGSMLKIDSNNFSVVKYSTTSLTEWRQLCTCVRHSLSGIKTLEREAGYSPPFNTEIMCCGLRPRLLCYF